MKRAFPVLIWCGIALVGLISGALGQDTAATEVAAETPADLTGSGLFDIEASLDNWTCQDEEAALRLTSGQDRTFEGASSLELIYTPREAAFAMLHGDMAPNENAVSMHFAVRVTEPTPLMYGVVEADDSHYVGYLHLMPGDWHEISVCFDELQLGEGSEDENELLDPGQITSVVIADLSNLEGESGRALGWKKGEQNLWLDSVILSEEEAPRRASVLMAPTGPEIIVSDFRADRIDAMALGGADLSLIKEGAVPTLRVGYSIGGWRWAGFVTSLPSVPLTRLRAVGLRAKNPLGCDLHVMLEERDKSRYVAAVALPVADTWSVLEIPLDSFGLDEFAVDENGQLDPDQLRVMVLVLDTFSAGVDRTNSGAMSVDEIRLLLSPGDGDTDEDWPAWLPFAK